MLVPAAYSWKVVLALALFGAVLASARARPPRRSTPAPDLRRLVVGSMALYGVGLVASLTHHPLLGIGLYAVGIVTSALAAWLSRGTDRQDPPRTEELADEPSPPPSDGAPRFDWPSFQREFEDYARRRREPVGSR